MGSGPYPEDKGNKLKKIILDKKPFSFSRVFISKSNTIYYKATCEDIILYLRINKDDRENMLYQWQLDPPGVIY